MHASIDFAELDLHNSGRIAGSGRRKKVPPGGSHNKVWSHKGVYRVELYAAVRRAVYVEGISEREAAKRFGIARRTVHKMLGYSAPPGYQRKQPVKRPKLDVFLGVIDHILEEDKQQIRKQRHTAKRIFERLKQEHSYAGGYTVVKDYVREQSLRQKEM